MYFRLLPLLIFLFISPTIFGQTTYCFGSKKVTSLPYRYEGDNCSRQPIQPLCGTNIYDGKGQVFEITIPQHVYCISVELSNLSGSFLYGYAIALSEVCPMGTAAECIWENTVPYTHNMDVEPGKTYYLALGTNAITLPGTGGGETPYVPGRTINCGDYMIDIRRDGKCTEYTDPCAMHRVELDSFPFSSSENTCNGKPLSSHVFYPLCSDSTYENYESQRNQSLEVTYFYPATDQRVCVDIQLQSPDSNALLNIGESCRKTANGQKCLGYTMDTAKVILEAGKDYYFTVSGSSTGCIPFQLDIDASPVEIISCENAREITGDIFEDEGNFECTFYPDPIELNCKPLPYYRLYQFVIDQPKCVSLNYQHTSYPGTPRVQVFKDCPMDLGSKCISNSVFPESPASKVTLFEPGTYYIALSSERQQSTYDFKFSLTEIDEDELLGSCEKPYENLNNSDSFNDYLWYYPCDDNRFWFPSTGYNPLLYYRLVTKLIRFVPQEDACYLFTTLEGEKADAMYLFKGCPDNSAKLKEAKIIKGMDSTSFSANLSAGDTVFFALASMYSTTPHNARVRITKIEKDDCLNCEENVCRACAGVSTETSEIDGWKKFVGTYNVPAASEDFTKDPINSPYGRHVVTSAGTKDPFSNIQVNNPFTGRFSIRLGNSKAEAQAERMTYTYKIDQSSTFLTYYYAVVFQDPGHAKEKQPYFRVRVFRENGEEINCGFFESYAGDGTAGFKNGVSGTLYKDWTPVTVPVGDYIGEEITVEFTTSDCALGDHFGYAYFDASCDKIGNLSEDVVLCEGHGNVRLEAPPGFSEYLWSNGSRNRITYYNGPGPYSIQMTSTSGCTYQFAGNIILQDTTLGTLDDIKAICNNDSVILEAHPGFQTYTWNTGDNSQSIKTNKPGKYLVEMSTFQGCIWRDSINLRQILNPLKNGFQQEQICEDSASNLFLTDTLNLTELDTISWLLDSSTEYRNTNHIKFQGQPGWHSLSLKINREDLCSFSLLDSIFIYPSFYPAPLLPDTFFCHLDSFQVQVAAIDSMNYRWSNGSVTEKANFKNPGEQYLIRELGACKDSIPFELEEIVIDNLHLKDTTICWYDSIFVGPQAQDQVSYLWSTADTTANIFIKTPDKYVLTATQENCKVVDSLILDYHRQAHVKLPPDTSICFFDTLTIGFADPKNHLWSTGETSDSIRVFAEGYYILTLTDSYCTERDTFYLDTLSAPSPFNFSDTSICWYDSLSLGVAPEPQVSYLWNTGDTDSQITLSDSGKYILRAELNSCQQSDSMRLNYHRETFLKLPEDTLICAGDSIRIGFADEKNHLWSTGEIADSIFIKTEGYFSLRVYDEYCSETDSIFIDTLAPPIIALREDTTVCQGAILSIGDEVYRAIYYNWNTGEEQNFIQVQKDGEYILNAFNGACWVADTFNLITYENPIIDYFKYTEEICKYDSFLVDLNCLNCIFLSDSLSKHKKTYYPGDTLEFRAVTPNSCYFYKRIEFEVKSDCYFVYVANAFSPDNDGVNEGFAPVTSTTNIAQYQFSIYNRWGEQIFTSSNIESSWDGTFNGREVQNDVYVWQLNLRFTDEVKTRQLRGTVQLLR